MRRLYVISNCTTPTFIGILSEIKQGSNDPYGQRGTYQFEYKLGKKPPSGYWFVTGLPDITKTYVGSDVLEWLTQYLPSQNGKRFLHLALESAGLSEYDEWEWLKVFGRRNVSTNVLLLEELPEGVIRYDV